MANKTHKDSGLPHSDRHSQALKNTQEKMDQALASWKKRVGFFERLNLPRQPWCFLLGSGNSGKTSLLANCGLSFQSDHSSQVDASKPTRNPQFWSNANHLFVDIPGDWYSADEGSKDEQRFHYLLQLTHMHRKKSAPTNVLQVIDFNKIASHAPQVKAHEFDLVSKQLQFMSEWNRKAKINLIINKADSIPGFQEFFSHLTHNERKKPCGLALSFKKDEPTVDALRRQLSAFADQINAQTIRKLHQERSQKKRDAMKDFPFQVERLTEAMAELLEALPTTTIQSIKGLYLTSCAQANNVSSLFQDDGTDSLPIQLTTGNKKKQQVYFVDDLFLSLAGPQQPITEHKPIWSGEYTHTVLAILVLVATSLSIHAGFNNSKATLSQLNDSLIANTSKKISTLPQSLNELNRLEYIRLALIDDQRFDANWLGLTTVSSLASSTNDIYFQLLNKPFKNYVFSQLTDKLNQDIKTQSASLFYDLATYLRITRSDISPNEIIPWFNERWSEQFPNNPEAVSLLVNSLSNLLTEKHTQFTPNQNLIKRAQRLLEKSPPSQIVFMMLTTQLSQAKKVVNIGQPGSLQKPLLTINPLYSLNRYEEIVNAEIPRLAKQLTKDNWVLNKPLFRNLTPARSKELVDSAKNLYLTAFSQNWQDAFNNLNISQTTTLDADLQLSTYLSSFDSGIWQKLQAILNFLLTKDELNISEKKYWEKIKNNLSSKSNQKLLLAALKENSSYLRKILYADNVEQFAFEQSKKRMMSNPASNPLQILLTLGKISPKPVAIWLTKLSAQSWKQMLQLSVDHVNTGWEETLYANYVNTIQNRYPIFTSSNEDISVTDFNQFFGIGGSIQTFYSNYLDGFVDTKKSYWTLKSVAGEKLPIQRSALDAIIRGSLIQKMFYKDNKKVPTIAFALKPITLSNTVKSFVLNVGGQMYTVSSENAQPFKGTWPGPDGNFVTMRFTTTKGSKPTITKNGPWAWLRLLQGEQVTGSASPTDFTVVFDLAGNAASFRLKADNRINPYLPNLLGGFRLSKDLSTEQAGSSNSQ